MRLSQVIAHEKIVRESANRRITDVYHLLQKNPLLSGQTRTYEPKDDEGDRLPSENQKVVVSVGDQLNEAVAAFNELLDAAAAREYTNGYGLATADVVVNGTTLLSKVPVGYLLLLEKQLGDVLALISKLPTLDPSRTWTFDTQSGVYRSEKVDTTRSKKVPRVLVKAEATDKHPAQTEVYHEDVFVGTWSTVALSGAVPETEKLKYKVRAEELLTAVKNARHEANTVTAETPNVGKVITDYVFVD